MDLVADMLFDRLQREHAATDRADARPSGDAAARRPAAGSATPAVAARLSIGSPTAVGLPARGRRFAAGFDLFHIVDHSYAQLVHRLPADRTS